MSAAPKEPREIEPTYAPLDCELVFHVQVKIAGVVGPLEIRAQRVSTIQRTLRLLKQNGLLVEGQPAATNGAAPVCPEHQKALKKSQYQGYYCTARNEDGSYCSYKTS